MKSFLMHRVRLLLASGLFFGGTAQIMALPAFPGAAGFGSETVGGRDLNAAVIKVTNLNDTGSGSLREALLTPGPRYIIFEVSGIIRLNSQITLLPEHSHVTVFGQTAPAPGIIIEGHVINVRTNDVIIQHIAFRPSRKLHLSPANGTISTNPLRINPGYEMAQRDSVVVGAAKDNPDTPANEQTQAYNVIIDHCSHTWSCDEVVSTWGNGDWGKSGAGTISDVTFSNCIFAEALRETGHTSNDNGSGTPEAHCMGPIIGRNSTRISMLRNLFAFNEQRNPMMRDDVSDVLIVNNLVYHPGTWRGNRIQVGSAGTQNRDLVASIKGNVVLMQSGNTDTTAINFTSPPTNTSVYLTGNASNVAGTTVWNPTNGDQWNVSLTNAPTSVTHLTSEPSVFTSASLNLPALITGASNIETYVLANAGARPAARDAVDARIVDQVRQRYRDPNDVIGAFIDSPAERVVDGTFASGELAGFPEWGTVTATRTVPSSPNTIEANGYSRIENWVHSTFTPAVQDTLNAKLSAFDTFSDGNDSGWSPLGTTSWSVTSGAYRQSNTSADARAELGGTSWTDQVVEAKVLPLSFNGTDRWVGLHARFRDLTHSYYVALREPSTVQLRKIDGSSITTFQSVTNFDVDPNVWYKVRLSAVGGAISATVTNLTTSASITLSGTDSTPIPSGHTALVTYMASADFDDVFSSPFATDVPQVVDDFDDGNSTGWSATNGTWAVSSGVLQQSSTSGGARLVPTAATTWGDQTIQADVRVNSVGGPTGFVAVYGRYQDINNSYFLALRSGGTLELKKVTSAGGSVFIPGTSAVTVPGFALGTWYTLRLEISGPASATQLKGYVNGQVLVSGTDSNPAAFTLGKAGVGTYLADASFDDLAITAP
ncbi:MAG TPA: hypothetical protein VFT72_16630 [Opitutaceae bacterium]|nr:hypothetical protein [Opitutaceae bacterium]